MSSTKASFGSSVGLAIAAVYALTDQGFFPRFVGMKRQHVASSSAKFVHVSERIPS